MRQIIVDTETTGLEPANHRIIEIGCVELKNRRKTDRFFHRYLNPERDIEDGAFDVHGISNDFLSDKPLFRDIANEFIEFVRDAELIIHNAPFDVEFINSELERLGSEWKKLEDYCSITDTLVRARELHPGQKNSLDALCVRYSVDNSQRDVHGALIDAHILADVYLAMTRSQTSLFLDNESSTKTTQENSLLSANENRPALRLIHPSAQELEAHQRFLDKISEESGGRCIWKKKAGK